MGMLVQTISDQAYRVIRDRILSGDLAPGAPIRQDAVAAGLGVSKIPLREALSRLEQDGLISSYPNRGYAVRPLLAAEAEEVFALRLKLEPDAAGAAARVASEAEQDHAEALLQALEQEAGAARAVELNRAFHMALVRPGAGLVTVQIVERLHVLAERYVNVHLKPTGRPGRAESEHRAMLKAWRARRGEAVAELMSEHIARTVRDLRVQLRA
jgi:DNA-binding GntR family transcriptional regulator